MATYYVSKTGNNANSGLSLVLAKRTMFDSGADSGAYEAASNGDTILFDDGVYVDSEIECSAGANFLITAKGLKFDSVNPYGATIATTSTSDSIVKTSGTFSGLTLSFGKIILSGSGGNLPIYGIRFAASATSTLDLGAVKVEAVSQRSVFLNIANTVAATIIGNGCIFNNSQSGLYASALGPASIIVENLTYTNAAVTANVPAISLWATAENTKIQLINPTVNSNLDVTFPNANYSAIQIVSVDDALIYNPHVTITTDSVAAGHGSAYGVEIKSNSATITAANGRIIGGNVNIDVYGGIAALIGTDTAGAFDNKCNNGIIKGVTVNAGPKFQGASGHGIFSGNNTGTVLQGNIAKGLSLGVLLKATISGSIIGNKTFNCNGKHVYLKGCTSCNVEGNESYLSETDTGSVLYFGINGAVNNVTCTAKNNIVVGHGAIAGKYIVREASQDVTLSNNMYVTPSGASVSSVIATDGATDYSTVAEYLAAVEANGCNLSKRPDISILEKNNSGLYISPAPGFYIPI